MKRIIKERSKNFWSVLVLMFIDIYKVIITAFCTIFQFIGYLFLWVNFLMMKIDAKLFKDPDGYNKNIENSKRLHDEFLERRKLKMRKH